MRTSVTLSFQPDHVKFSGKVNLLFRHNGRSNRPDRLPIWAECATVRQWISITSIIPILLCKSVCYMIFLPSKYSSGSEVVQCRPWTMKISRSLLIPNKRNGIKQVQIKLQAAPVVLVEKAILKEGNRTKVHAVQPKVGTCGPGHLELAKVAAATHNKAWPTVQVGPERERITQLLTMNVALVDPIPLGHLLRKRKMAKWKGELPNKALPRVEWVRLEEATIRMKLMCGGIRTEQSRVCSIQDQLIN